MPSLRHIPRPAAGFSLIEIMVGMVVGMLGIIIIMQVFSVSEGQKRTTTGGDDAQNNGAIALYGLQRDMRQSGYLSSAYKMIGCDVQLRAGVTLSAMAPVTINHALIPAGDANTDTLLVVYGNGNGNAEGDTIDAQAGTTYTVKSPRAFAANDYVVAEPETRPSPCSGASTLLLDRIAAAPVGTSVAVTTGAAGMVSGTLYNLGQSPKILAYAIRSGNLTVCDYMVNNCSQPTAAFWVPIASGIVSLRAQYGRDTLTAPHTPNPPPPLETYIVDTYDQTTPTTNCGWARVPAVRVALVARSAQFNKTAVTAAAPAWAGSAGSAIDLSADAAWQNYRYKVFQTTVPLRNVTWMGVQEGC